MNHRNLTRTSQKQTVLYGQFTNRSEASSTKSIAPRSVAGKRAVRELPLQYSAKKSTNIIDKVPTTKQKFKPLQLVMTVALLALTMSLFPEQAATYLSSSGQTYSSEITLKELSLQLSIPASKLKETLGLTPETGDNLTLASLNINEDDIEKAKLLFKKQIWEYSWNIVIVGMLVIFTSLALTGFLVGQLQNVVKRTTQNISPEKMALLTKITESKPPLKHSYNEVVAAITAVHLHIREAEESNRMIIAWNREPVSVWKASAKMLMPNRVRETLRK